jgi:hypothetical protein
MFSARSRTASHERSSFLTFKCFSPREDNFLKSSWSITDKSVSQSIPQFHHPSKHLFRTSFQKKLEFFWKNPVFLPNSQSRVPGPSTASVFVQIIMSSKWTGVSLKGSRRNCQETAPGEEEGKSIFQH